MGSIQAAEFAESVSKGQIALIAALDWHLSCNHYPPVPSTFVPVCIKAIEKANGGEWDALIKLPKGCSYRGQSKAPVSAIVEQHHLHSFIEQED